MFSNVIQWFPWMRREQRAPAPKAQRVNRVAGGSAIPVSIHVCARPQDLPPYDTVVSGPGKGMMVVLKPPEADKLVVILDARSKIAHMVASQDLYRTQEAARLFAYVRQKLEACDVAKMPKAIWATQDLVAGLAKLKQRDVSKTLQLTMVDAKDTEHGKWFGSVVEYGLDVRASDMHIEVDGAYALIRYRVDGRMEPMENGSGGQVIAQLAREGIALAFNKLSDHGSATGSNFQGREFLESTVTFDTGVHQVKLRCDNIPTDGGFNFIARFTRSGRSELKFTYESIGYMPSHVATIKRAIGRRKGIILMVGIPGSGKTTSIRAMLESIENADKLKIATIDTPIEQKIAGISQTLLQLDESDQEESDRLYNKAIQHWVRGNPDIMSLGEIRSLASAKAAMKMAEIGCLTFGTVHAHTGIGAFQRLLSLGIDLHSMTAPGIMNLFVHQTLVPQLCNECKVPLSEANESQRMEMAQVGSRFSVDVSNIHFAGHDKNCPNCKGTGVKGRIAVCEMLEYDPLLLDYIVDRDLYGAEQYWLSKGDGKFDSDRMDGKPAFYHAFLLAQKGIIAPTEVRQFGYFDTFEFKKEERPKVRGVRVA